MTLAHHLSCVAMAHLFAIQYRTMLPLSPWHCVMGWVDIITDVLSIIATFHLAAQLPPPRCSAAAGTMAGPFFYAAAALQIAFLVGNQVTQTMFACLAAHKHGRNTVLAGLRGFFNLELAYHESKRSQGTNNKDVAAATAASLNHKMIELVWEVPQTVVALSVLMANMIVRNGQQPDASAWIRFMGLGQWATTIQFVTTLVGLFSLSLGALDFIRLHPMSYWAYSQAPDRSFLWLFDVSSDTWCRSVVIGVYAAASVITRASIYTSIMFVWSTTQSVIDPALNANLPGTSPWYFVTVIAAVFVVCLLFLLPLILNKCRLDAGGYRLSPPATWVLASVLSTFINIPWTTSPVGSDAWRGRYSCWPAWIMAFIFPAVQPLFTVMFFVGFYGSLDPCDRFQSRQPSQSISKVIPGSITFGIVTILAAAAEFGTFLGMSGWVTQQRRRFKAGSLAELHFASEIPALCYTTSWSTLTSHRVTGVV
jgi:hypothetical protein